MSQRPQGTDAIRLRGRSGRPRIFHGWWVVAVSLLLGIFQGGVLFYGFTLIITPLRDETGWSATQVTAVFPIFGVIAAAIAPALGFGFDRIGPRPLVTMGLLLMGAGLVLMGQAKSLQMFYVAFIVANVGSTSIWMATAPAVANWFVRMRGRALGIYTLGFGLAGIMAPPLFQLIEIVGWRDALLIVGLVAWALLPVSVWVIRRRPEDIGQWPDGADGPPATNDDGESGEINVSAGKALRTRTFWLLSIGSMMVFLTISALQVHWSPLLQSVGFSERSAANLLFVLPLSTVVGRIGFGFLVDIWDKRRMAAFAFVLQGIAVFVLIQVEADRWWLLPAFFVFWGFGFGGTVVTRPALQAEMFGRFSFGAINGILFMTGEAGFALAPHIASLGFESMGSYIPVFLVFGVLSVLAAPIVLAMRKPDPPVTPLLPGDEQLATEIATGGGER